MAQVREFKVTLYPAHRERGFLVTKVNFSNPMYVVPAVKLSVVVVVCCICVWGAMDLVLWKRNSVLYDVPNVESEAFRESYTELILELTKIEESAVRPEASTVSNRSSLFEGRQKIAVVEQAPKTNPAALLQLIELKGITGGVSRSAIIMYKKNGEYSTVSVGDDLGEFKVQEIGAGSVVLKWREDLFELKF